MTIKPHQTYGPKLDYMTEFAAWLAVQNGQAADLSAARTRPFGENVAGPAQYLRDGRGLSACVHADISFEPYLNACLLLLTQQQPTPYSEANPCNANMTRAGFGTFGSAYARMLVSTVAALALKASGSKNGLSTGYYDRRPTAHWYIRRCYLPPAVCIKSIQFT